MSPITRPLPCQHLFFDYFDLWQEKRNQILSDARLAACPVSGLAELSLIHIGGDLHQPHLGDLLRLWKSGDWTGPCPECQGPFHLVSLVGSPFSNSSSLKGYCTGCKKGMQLTFAHPKYGFPKVIALYNQLRASKIISPKAPLFAAGQQPQFDWATGQKGRYTPPVHLMSGVVGLSLPAVLNLLQVGRSDALIRNPSGEAVMKAVWDLEGFQLQNLKLKPVFSTRREDYSGQSTCGRYRWDGATLWETTTERPVLGWDWYDPHLVRNYRSQTPSDTLHYSENALWKASKDESKDESTVEQIMTSDQEVPLVALLLAHVLSGLGDEQPA